MIESFIIIGLVLASSFGIALIIVTVALLISVVKSEDPSSLGKSINKDVLGPCFKPFWNSMSQFFKRTPDE